MSTPRPPVPPPDVPAWRLLVTLATAGAVGGFLLVFVFGWTQPTIRANKARALEAAIREVLEAPARYDTLYVVAGALALGPPDGADPAKLAQVYLGYRADGERIGFAIPAGEPGFQDVVRLIFGYDPAKRALLGMKVLESRETPGLGDRIEKDTGFVAQFAGAAPPLVGVKPSAAAGRDPHEVDMITGATISSKTVIRAINRALERFGPLLEAYADGGRQ